MNKNNKFRLLKTYIHNHVLQFLLKIHCKIHLNVVNQTCIGLGFVVAKTSKLKYDFKIFYNNIR